jgi:hypothetical protein
MMTEDERRKLIVPSMPPRKPSECLAPLSEDEDAPESRCPTPCDDDCDAPCHEEHQPSWKRTHALDGHGDDLPNPNPYTGEGHGTQAQEG